MSSSVCSEFCFVDGLSFSLLDYTGVNHKKKCFLSDFLAAFIIVLTLFTTVRMAIAIAYSRDQLLSLRNSGVLLNHDACLEVSRLRLRRRGCRTARWRTAAIFSDT